MTPIIFLEHRRIAARAKRVSEILAADDDGEFWSILYLLATIRWLRENCP